MRLRLKGAPGSPIYRHVLAKFSKAPNQYLINFVSDYFKKLLLCENFKLDPTTEDYLFKLPKNVKVTKTAGIDQISGNVLIDKVPTFAKPTIELCNLSMTLESFPDAYQIAM